MAVITLAQTKGGSGKTTTCEVLIAEFAFRGFSIGAIDLDPNRPLSRFVSRTPALANINVTVPDGTGRISDLIADSSRQNSVVIIDLMGAATPDMMVAVGFSDLVLIPSQLSEPDVRCGIETWRIIQEVERLGRRMIAKAVLFTRTNPTFKTRAQDHARRQYDRLGVSILNTEFMERVVFKEMTFNGTPPNFHDRDGNAAKNVISLFDEILALLPKQPVQMEQETVA